jgi:hypothetical protein
MPFKDAEIRRTYHREYKRLKRAGESTTPGQTPVPAEFRLKTAQDVLNLIAEQIELVRSTEQAGVLEKARCIGYLSVIALKAIETGDLSVRLEAIERAMKVRSNAA